MSGHIIHELPGGSAVTETFTGEDLAAVTVHDDSDQALEAVLAEIAGDNPELTAAIDAKREELRTGQEAEADARYPFRHASLPRFCFEAFRSIRLGRSR